MYSEENKYDVLVIKSYLKVNKLSKKEFCKCCGIEEKTLNKLYNNRTDILVSDLIKISNELKIPVASLFSCEFYSKVQTRFIL
ncbi:MAG: helix-turn-helix transcriptional regulator [Clostridia bacterium]|nr:helix-turn-helix transcriptional regulator [Clostridia bacterium]